MNTEQDALSAITSGRLDEAEQLLINQRTAEDVAYALQCLDLGVAIPPKKWTYDALRDASEALGRAAMRVWPE